MVRVDENVTVALDKSGSPIGFSWRNGHYLVSGKPVRWYARRQWWVDAARVQRGIGAGALEVEMWRMLADCGKHAIYQYEFIHDTLSDTWRLVRIYD